MFSDSTPFRFDLTDKRECILMYISEDIPFKPFKTLGYYDHTECLTIKINLRKTKRLFLCSYKPLKSNAVYHLSSLGKIVDHNLAQYDRIFLIGDLNLETTEKHIEVFCDIYHFKNLIKEPSCFENPNKPSCIRLLLTNCSKRFQDTQVLETQLSDFHKINIAVLTL